MILTAVLIPAPEGGFTALNPETGTTDERMITDYTDQIAEFWPTIMRAWEEHSDKRPVIECDFASRTVAAYPAHEYIESLSEQTRKPTHQEFDRVVDEGGVMVFIRDTENRVLQSYTFTSDDMSGERKPNE